MDNEDLDRFVERCAAKLFSDDPFEALSASQMLNQAHASIDQREFARKAQELAVFQGGSVLRLLLEGVAGSIADVIKGPSGDRTHSMICIGAPSQGDERVAPDGHNGSGKNKHKIPCILGLVALSSSKVVVEGLMRDTSNARPLAALFEYLVSYGLELLSKEEKDTVVPAFLVETGLHGLVNFARVSRVFREAVRQLPALSSLFKSMESICTKKVLGRVKDAERVRVLKVLVSSLMVSLSSSPDSQVWAIKNGLLRIVAAIYESTHRRQLSALLSKRNLDARVQSPAYRCNMALVFLAESEASRKKLNEVDGLSFLKAHKFLIESVQPEGQPWIYLKAKLSERSDHTVSGPQCEFGPDLSLLKTPACCKLLRRVLCGPNIEQTVCSWKMCNAGPEPDEGVGFRRCGQCQVARYCSKEHQKLHWRTHKKHCLAMPTSADPEEGRPERT